MYDTGLQKTKQSKPIEVIDVKTQTVDYYNSSSELERKSEEIYGIEFKHVRELRRAFDNGRAKLYKDRFIIKSYNSCND